MAEDERNDELQARDSAEDELLLSAQLPQPPTYTEIAIPAAFEPPPSYDEAIRNENHSIINSIKYESAAGHAGDFTTRHTGSPLIPHHPAQTHHVTNIDFVTQTASYNSNRTNLQNSSASLDRPTACEPSRSQIQRVTVITPTDNDDDNDEFTCVRKKRRKQVGGAGTGCIIVVIVVMTLVGKAVNEGIKDNNHSSGGSSRSSYSYSSSRNPCDSYPCKNGGACSTSNYGSSYQCQCGLQYTGARCETYKESGESTKTDTLANDNITSWLDRYNKYQACSFHQCLNGGTCKSTSGVKFRCICPAGYRGIYCEIKSIRTACSSYPCRNGATCNSTNTLEYTCSCPEGYNGTNCENKTASSDACSSQPCRNGGHCVIMPGSYVVTLLKLEFICSCPQGFAGLSCEKKSYRRY